MCLYHINHLVRGSHDGVADGTEEMADLPDGKVYESSSTYPIASGKEEVEDHKEEEHRWK